MSQRYGNQGGGGRAQRPPAPRQMPTPRADFFFRDDEDRKRDVARQSLLTDEALDQAQQWVHERLNSSQLRRFFHEVKGILASVDGAEDPEEAFIRVSPRLALLRSKAAYACPNYQPRNVRIPPSFRRYLETMVVNVRDVHDLRAFALAFEAAVGYFYGEGGAERGGGR